MQTNQHYSDVAPLIITISGDLGSGKSLLASALVDHWSAARYSTGMVQRSLAEQMGITTLELNKRAETDKTIDDQIDSVFRNLSQTRQNLVVDSRMAFHFLPASFRIKLEVHPNVAAMRIQKDTSRIGEGPYASLAEIEAAILARKSSERERFKRYYNVDIDHHAGYSLVVNTTCTPPDAVLAVVNTAIDLWQKNKLQNTLWISPRHLYVSTDPDALKSQAIENCLQTWPDITLWPESPVEVSKVGAFYVVTQGAEWVAAGLRAGKPLMPVRMTNQTNTLPDASLTLKWQTVFGYTHL
jgi:cytidylate kinase